MITFGQRVRMLRNYLRMTQSQLASSICSPSAISQMEADKTRPSDHTVVLLAERLQCSADWLVYGKEYAEIENTVRVSLELMARRHFREAGTLFKSIMESKMFTNLLMKNEIFYHLACCYIEQRQFDDAIPLLEDITRKDSPAGAYVDESLLPRAYLALAKCFEQRSLHKP